ncbi:MAG: hypothetical protein KF715_03750 [Candidatus Didemnitutus sp.]|nr:hypothetical protein [Candidatus Didemnitutus sp.]
MKSLRLRVALWFAASVAAVMVVFVGVTFLHLRHELRIEKWERTQERNADWALHGSYSESEVADIVGELWSLSLLYATPVLLLAMAAGYVVARRAFRPVEEMNRQLQGIGARNLGARVDVTRADHEIRAIGENINGLLVRLETSFQQLSDFSAQVAHELRTPLTLMRLQIEEAAGRIEPTLAESMQEELKRLSDYVDQCLLLATAEQGRLQTQPAPLDLREVVGDVVEAYALLAREEHRSIDWAASEATAHADPRYLRQLLHVVLSNALRHGEGTIVVRVRTEAGSAICQVLNRVRSGPAATSAGNGIGLRLARALATALAVELTAGPTAEGQFAASLRLRSPGR